MIPPSLCIVHSAADEWFAERLSQFLQAGCDVRLLDGGRMRSSEELLERVEDGFSADSLVLLLSESAWPSRCPRERWEPLLFEQARAEKVGVAYVLLQDCSFPALLRRETFFDASESPLRAMRGLKRWLWRRELAPGESFARKWSRDLEDMYATLADRSSSMHASPCMAKQFAHEAEHEFAAILWIYCQDLTLARVAGELAAELGMKLPGTAEQNCADPRSKLSRGRYLLILDAPAPEHLHALHVENGRTSTLIVSEPTHIIETPETFGFARELMTARRFAEAYELYYKLIHEGADKADCARDLVWICEQWDRIEEAVSLRPACLRASEQMFLFT